MDEDKVLKYKWEGIKAVIKWLSILEMEGCRFPDSASRFEIDAEHSALLKRLIENKPAYSIPPPLSFAYPNYTLMELGVDNPYEVIDNGSVLIIDQHPWKIVQTIDKNKWILKYRIRKHKDGNDVWSQTNWLLSQEKNVWILKALN